MSLIVPHSCGFQKCSDNLGSTVTNNAWGVAFTPGGSNADGTEVEILSALAHDCHFLVVGIYGTTLSNTDTSTLLDIRRDPAGGTSWADFISDLICGFIPIANAAGTNPFYYYFPIWIPAGTSLSARARQAAASPLAARIMIWAYGEPSRPEMWWCGQGVETLGATPASSEGTQVTAGTSSAFGSWTSIGSTTTKDYGALEFGMQGADAAGQALGYFWQIGLGSQILPGAPTIVMTQSTSESGNRHKPSPLFVNVPSGSQLQVRGACSATPEVMDVALYGIY